MKSVTRLRELLRGGMTFRVYGALFEKKTLTITVYLTPEGHYEQFLVIEQLWPARSLRAGQAPVNGELGGSIAHTLHKSSSLGEKQLG